MHHKSTIDPLKTHCQLLYHKVIKLKLTVTTLKTNVKAKKMA